jgi:hypothetical protein
MTKTPAVEKLTLWKMLEDGSRTRPSKAFWRGVDWGAGGNMLGLPFIAYEVGTAQRGEMLPTAAGRTMGLMTYPALSGVIAFGLAMIPGVNVATAGIAAGLMAMYPNGVLEDGMSRGIRAITDTAKQIRHIEMGGSYQDSQSAEQQRMRALQEMGGAMQTSRRWLGQEAVFFHR